MAMTFAIHMKRLRLLRGLSLATLANMTGYSESYLRNIENGSRDKPSVNAIDAIARALNADIAELFGGVVLTPDETDVVKTYREGKGIQQWTID